MTDNETRKPLVAPHTKAVRAFLEKWEKLPPLVRASAANHMVRELAPRIAECQYASEQAYTLGMHRRGEVGQSFALAKATMSELFVALTITADDEAVALGIDDLGVDL